MAGVELITFAAVLGFFYKIFSLDHREWIALRREEGQRLVVEQILRCTTRAE